MSQRVVESTIGRLITDAAFRERFFMEPAAVCRDHGLDLTPNELSALLPLDPHLFKSLAGHLDPKILRALTGGPTSDVARAQVQRATSPTSSRAVANGLVANRPSKSLAGRSAGRTGRHA